MWSGSHLCAGVDFSVLSALSIYQTRGEEAANELASLKSGISPCGMYNRMLGLRHLLHSLRTFNISLNLDFNSKIK